MKKLLVIVLVFAGLFSATAEAKPGHAAVASISLVEVSPVLGQNIHFNYTNPEGLKTLPCKQGVYECSWLQVHCYQGTTKVYHASKAGADSFTQFILGSPDMGNWPSGDAECQADLIEIRKGQHPQYDPPIFIIYASTFFHVDG